MVRMLSAYIFLGGFEIGCQLQDLLFELGLTMAATSVLVLSLSILVIHIISIHCDDISFTDSLCLAHRPNFIEPTTTILNRLGAIKLFIRDIHFKFSAIVANTFEYFFDLFNVTYRGSWVGFDNISRNKPP